MRTAIGRAIGRSVTMLSGGLDNPLLGLGLLSWTQFGPQILDRCGNVHEASKIVLYCRKPDVADELVIGHVGEAAFS